MRKAMLAALLTTTAIPSNAATITVDYSSADVPIVGISGHIDVGDDDTFKARTANMKSAVVALESTGGKMLVGMAIGEYIREKGFATAVVTYCASACGDIWLAGAKRFMSVNARIGFHQPSVSPGSNATEAAGNAISGAYYSKLGLGYGAIIWLSEAGPTDIKLITPSEAKRVGIQYVLVDADGNTLEDTYQPRTAFNTTPAPSTYVRTPNPPYVPPSPAPYNPIPSPPAPTLQSKAEEMVRYLVTVNHNDAQWYGAYYWEQVNYYGKMTARDDVINQIAAYFVRWPKRTYKITNMVSSCNEYTCVVSGTMDFVAENANQRSTGSASFSYTLGASRNNSFYITSESGSNISRQIVNLKPAVVPHQMVR